MPTPTRRRTLPHALRDIAAAWRGPLLTLLLASMTCQALAQPVAGRPSTVSLEYAVKATYLYKLAPFVNWPPTVFAAPDAPFRICVVGDDPFDDFLDKAVAGRSLGAHPFEVRRLASLTPAVDCQIIFVSGLPSQDLRHTLDAVSGKPVLTVTDSTAPRRGGIVQFVIHHGRVGFEIDTAAATRNHLTISSKLLSLAVAVRDTP